MSLRKGCPYIKSLLLGVPTNSPDLFTENTNPYKISGSWLQARRPWRIQIWKFKSEGRSHPTFLSPVLSAYLSSWGSAVWVVPLQVWRMGISFLWSGLHQTCIFLQVISDMPWCQHQESVWFSGMWIWDSCSKRAYVLVWGLVELLAANYFCK